MIIGVGCDIVSIQQVKKELHKSKLLQILTEEEQKLYRELPPVRQAEWLAGRFAAKEAVIKAMSTKMTLVLSEVSILYEGEKPVCYIDGYSLHVSISHDQSFAIAYAIVEKV